METSEVLNRAADLIEERGWVQAGEVSAWFPSCDSSTPVCLEGAIRFAAREGESNKQAVTGVVRDYLTGRSPECINEYSGHVIPFAWNDAPGRTASEVIEVLRACALIESAREEQDAAWETYAELVSL